MSATRSEGAGSIAAALLAAIVGLFAGATLTVAAGTLLGVLGVDVGVIALVVISVVLTQGVAFGGVALAYLRLRAPDLVSVRVPTARDLAWVGAGYVLALLAAMAGAAVVVVAGAEAAPNQLAGLAVEDPELLLVLVPFSFLLIGPGEELLFRGVVQGSFREPLGAVVAVALASAVFAVIHYVALTGAAGGRIVTIGILFLPSLVFGTAYERTRNIAVPALIHGGYNATLFVLGYVALRFGPAAPT